MDKLVSQLQNSISAQIRAFAARTWSRRKLPMTNRICQFAPSASLRQNHRIFARKRVSQLALVCVFLAATAAFGSEQSEKLSEALGHLIGKNLKSLDVPIDLGALAKGMQEESEGISPLSEEECVQALSSLEEQSYTAKKEKNLQEAEAFLKENKTRKGMVQLEKGKIQFEILKKGKGQIVQPYNSPLVRYKGSFLSGESFHSNFDEELIALDEVIPGLKLGIIGMREREVRKLYIHPELAYGKEERLHPNSLLIFEVEIVEADASSETLAASDFPADSSSCK